MRRALALAFLAVVVSNCRCSEDLTGLPTPEIALLDDAGNDHRDADPWLVIPFGDADTGQSVTRAVTIKNANTGRLRLDAICVVNAADLATAIDDATPCLSGAQSFTFDTTIVGTEIGGGDSVALDVTFSPLQGGPQSLFLRVASNANAEPRAAVQLTGRGTDGRLCADESVIDFGDVAIGTTANKTVTLTNCGVKPVSIDTFALVANPDNVFGVTRNAAAVVAPIGPLAENESITLDLTFTPAQPVAYRDARAGNIGMTTAAPFVGQYNLILVGNGKTPPSCQVNVVPQTLNFASVASGTSATRQIVVASVGQCACTLTALTPPSLNVGFSLPTPPTLPLVLKGTTGCDTDPAAAASAPSNLLIDVNYASPVRQTPLVDRDTVVVTTDAPVEPVRTVNLEANGGGTPFCQLEVAPQAPASGFGFLRAQARYGVVEFGRTSIHISKKLPITLKNIGNARCTISNVAYDSANNTTRNEFSLENDSGGAGVSSAPVTVEPGATKTYFAVFAPTHVITSSNPFDALSFGSYSGASTVETGLQQALFCGGQLAGPNTKCNGVTFTTDDTTTDVSSSQRAPGVFSIGFSGTPVEPTVDIIPPELDFGRVTLDCGSPEERTTIYNTGSIDVVVREPTVDPAATPVVFDVTTTSNASNQWPYTIPPGGSLTVLVRYFARTQGVQAATLLLPTVEQQNGQPVDGPPITIPLRGEGTLDRSQVDIFDQASDPKVDVLFVVDDSGSMADDQDQLAANFPQFFTASNVSNADYHIAVTTTLTAGAGCIPNPLDPASSCPDDDMSGYYTACTGNDRFITRQSTTPENQFRCNVQVSDSRNPARDTSDSAEGGLRGAYNFLSAPRVDDPAINGGFLRDDAKLHVIMVSDEPDQSRGPTDLYIDFFRNLKGFRNESLVAVSAIAKRDGEQCASDDGDVGDARYGEVVDAMHGRFQSICDQDWSATMRSLGLDSIGLQVEFFLSRAAESSALRVCVRQGSASAACNAVQQTTDGAANGYFYDAASNSIVFNPGSVPPRGSRIEVNYETFCFRP